MSKDNVEDAFVGPKDEEDEDGEKKEGEDVDKKD